MDPGSVVRVMFISSFPRASLVIAGLGRARDKVRREMSRICISLSLSTPTWATWKADLVALSEVLCTQAATTTQENSPRGYPNFILSPNVPNSSNSQTEVAVHHTAFFLTI